VTPTKKDASRAPRDSMLRRSGWLSPRESVT
jgi:hypothetical protein